MFKAATFYILDALVSPQKELSQAAEDGVKKLVIDYLKFGNSDISGKHTLNCIFTILAGYRLHNPQAKDIGKLLHDDSNLLQQFEEFWVKNMEPAQTMHKESQAPAATGRTAHLKNLPQLGVKLYQLGEKPLSSELFLTAAYTLIGLSQDAAFLQKSISHSYKGLTPYLGKAPYNTLLVNNNYGDTTKMYKAATFYILSGLQSKNPALVAEAQKAFEMVKSDHQKDGLKDVSRQSLENCITTISKSI